MPGVSREGPKNEPKRVGWKKKKGFMEKSKGEGGSKKKVK